MESGKNLNDLREWRAHDEMASNVGYVSKENFLTDFKKWIADQGIHFIRAHYRQFVLKYIANKDRTLTSHFNPSDFDAACLMLIADLMYSMDLHLSLSVFTAEVVPNPNKTPRFWAVHSRLKVLIGHSNVKDLPLTFQDVAFILDKFGIPEGTELFYSVVHDYLNNKDPLLHRLIRKLFKVSNDPPDIPKERLKGVHKTGGNNKTRVKIQNDRTNRYIQTDPPSLPQQPVPRKTCHEFTQVDSSVFDQLQIPVQANQNSYNGKSLCKNSRMILLKNKASNTKFNCRCYSVEMSHKSSNTRMPPLKDGACNTQSVKTLNTGVQTIRELKSVEVNTSNQASTQTETVNCDLKKIPQVEVTNAVHQCQEDIKDSFTAFQSAGTRELVYIERLARNYEEKLELMSTIDKLRDRLDDVTNRNEELQSQLSFFRRRQRIEESGAHIREYGDTVGPIEFGRVRDKQALNTIGQGPLTRTAASQTHQSGRIESIAKNLRNINESIASLKNEGKIIDAIYKK